MEKTATLIMLDKPILVNEEKIEIGNFFEFKGRTFEQRDDTFPFKKECRKIIAGHEGTKRLTFNLSEEDAKRIEYVDVEKLAYQHRRSYQDSFEGMNECIMNDAIHQQIGFVKGFETALSLTPKKYTEEDMTNFLEFSENGYYPVIIKDNLGNHKINWCEKNGIKEYTKKELFEIFLNQRQPNHYPVEYTETETEIIITKIL